MNEIFTHLEGISSSAYVAAADRTLRIKRGIDDRGAARDADTHGMVLHCITRNRHGMNGGLCL